MQHKTQRKALLNWANELTRFISTNVRQLDQFEVSTSKSIVADFAEKLFLNRLSKETILPQELVETLCLKRNQFFEKMRG